MKNALFNGSKYFRTLPAYLFSAVLFIYCGQMFISSADTISIQTDTDAMLSGEKLKPEQLANIASHTRDAISVRDTGDFESMLGLSLILAGSDAPETLLEAKEATTRSLILSPANPYAWARLSTIDQLSHAPEAEILLHWRLSILTGQHEPRLYPSRIATGLQLSPLLSHDDRQLLFHQIVVAWHSDPQVVIDAASDEVTLNFIRAALASDLSSLIEFEKKRLPK